MPFVKLHEFIFREYYSFSNRKALCKDLFIYDQWLCFVRLEMDINVEFGSSRKYVKLVILDNKYIINFNDGNLTWMV
ncbi:MAG: hypothetical protein BA863_07045 [Desulfovibrio sp. S3730MH75]|nr:MAG: hypothetical protein BA863_07045 [Desulfovibrio sp. S3730MH75]